MNVETGRTMDATGATGTTLPTRSSLAVDALRASRARLAARMLPPPDPPAGSAARPQGAGSWKAAWRAWRHRLDALDHTTLGPLLRTTGEVLQAWWQRHPWHASVNAVGDGLRDVALPVVRRHPVASVLLGAGLGAAMVWWQPWRASWLQPHVRPLPGRLRRWAWQQANQLPMQALIPALLAAWRLSSSGPAAAEPAGERPAGPGVADTPHPPTSSP